MKQALLLVLSLALASCSALGLSPSSSVGPVPQLVSSSRATHDVLAPRWRAYVAADPNLSPLMREQLLALVVDWELVIRKAEDFIGPTTPTEVPPAPEPEPERVP